MRNTGLELVMTFPKQIIFRKCSSLVAIRQGKGKRVLGWQIIKNFVKLSILEQECYIYFGQLTATCSVCWRD